MVAAETVEESAEQQRWFVASLERGLRVIRAFGAGSADLSVAEVAERAEMSRAAARRFLMTLEALGYLGRDGRQRYRLRPKALSLGYAFLSSLGLEERVMPVLRELMALTTETTNLAMLEEGEVVYVARSVAYRPLHMSVHVGARLPAYATSLGQVLLAGLSDEDFETYLAETDLRPLTPKTCTEPARLRQLVAKVRREGHAQVADQIAIGIVSIAVPVRDPEGRPVAALNISSQSGRWSGPEMVKRFLEPVTAAVRELSPAMAGVLPGRGGREKR